MQKSVGIKLGKRLLCGLLVLLLSVSFAQAEEKAEEGGLYDKLEPFTVNLVGLSRVVQIAITLKSAKMESANKVKIYEPAIRNEIIYLLCTKTPEEMLSPEGKQKLVAELRVAANKAMGMTAKDGVAEALIELMIIQ